MIVGNDVDKSSDLIETVLLGGIIDRQRQRRRIDLAGRQRRIGLRRSADDEQLIIARVFEAFDFQDLAQREGHAGGKADGAERRAAQVFVGFKFLGGHDRLAETIDDAADDNQIEPLLDRSDRRVGRAAGNFQRAAGQRLDAHVRGANDHELYIESLAVEESLLGRHPERAISQRLGRGTNAQLDSLLSES